MIYYLRTSFHWVLLITTCTWLLFIYIMYSFLHQAMANFQQAAAAAMQYAAQAMQSKGVALDDTTTATTSKP